MKKIIQIILSAYRWLISPIFSSLGCRCRFHPSCSEYARLAVSRFPLRRALPLAGWRLLKCGPWHPGGIDEV